MLFTDNTITTQLFSLTHLHVHLRDKRLVLLPFYTWTNWQHSCLGAPGSITQQPESQTQTKSILTPPSSPRAGLKFKNSILNLLSALERGDIRLTQPGAQHSTLVIGPNKTLKKI